MCVCVGGGGGGGGAEGGGNPQFFSPFLILFAKNPYVPYVHAYHVRVTVGDSGLCCCCTCVTYFER